LKAVTAVHIKNQVWFRVCTGLTPALRAGPLENEERPECGEPV